MNHCNPIGIYLAAGSSRRFGKDKLNQHFKGKPLGTYGLSAALKSSLKKVIVVTKQGDVPWLKPLMNHQKCDQVICNHAHLGQAHSIQTGLHYAERNKANAIVIMLADQPFITGNMIDTLIATYRDNEGKAFFVASHHNGIICPPILFSHHMFLDLYTLKGDDGAKYLLSEKASEGIFLNFPCEKAFYDIDTPRDYKRVLKEDLS